jgi:hypothetical protein
VGVPLRSEKDNIPGRAAVSVNAGTFEAIAESWPILTVLFTPAKIRE